MAALFVESRIWPITATKYNSYLQVQTPRWFLRKQTHTSASHPAQLETSPHPMGSQQSPPCTCQSSTQPVQETHSHTPPSNVAVQTPRHTIGRALPGPPFPSLFRQEHSASQTQTNHCNAPRSHRAAHETQRPRHPGLLPTTLSLSLSDSCVKGPTNCYGPRVGCCLISCGTPAESAQASLGLRQCLRRFPQARCAVGLQAGSAGGSFRDAFFFPPAAGNTSRRTSLVISVYWDARKATSTCAVSAGSLLHPARQGSVQLVLEDSALPSTRPVGYRASLPAVFGPEHHPASHRTRSQQHIRMDVKVQPPSPAPTSVVCPGR